ncbi:hypothetical protein [Methylocapsa aurea]|uniref:hypothetical protein n=1 Tax=Methylocapsa aurea TaxID=663610 RepID=UPI0012EBEC48|nr:hypothetical protein [Methylocapsa aurea]
MCGVSESTVRTWCEKHNIGRRVAGGPWQVSKPAILMLLDGDAEALRQYQAGERAGRVAEYFRRAEAARRAELQCAQTPQSPQLPQSASGALGSGVTIVRRTSED